MSKVVIPGFKQSIFANRVIGNQERLNEGIDLPECGGQIFLLSFNPGEIRPMHSHDEIRLTFVRSGRMKLTFEHSVQEMGPGDFFSSFPKVSHSIEVLGDQPLNLIEIIIPNPCER